MKIQYCFDLHLEFEKNRDFINNNPIGFQPPSGKQDAFTGKHSVFNKVFRISRWARPHRTVNFEDETLQFRGLCFQISKFGNHCLRCNPGRYEWQNDMKKKSTAHALSQQHGWQGGFLLLN